MAMTGAVVVTVRCVVLPPRRAGISLLGRARRWMRDRSPARRGRTCIVMFGVVGLVLIIVVLVVGLVLIVVILVVGLVLIIVILVVGLLLASGTRTEELPQNPLGSGHSENKNNKNGGYERPPTLLNEFG